MDGYEATMHLAHERPDLLPLARLIYEMGDEAFNAGLDELVRRGLLEATSSAPTRASDA